MTGGSILAVRTGGPALTISGLEIAYAGVGLVVDIAAWSLGGGGALAIEGPSGVGKTSLLHALAGLERPRAGMVRWGDVSLWELSDAARDRWRRRELGLVFQDIHLIDGFSAIDNVTLPVLFDRIAVPRSLRERGRAMLQELGIAATDRPVTVMSRGERQRVALARALLGRPAVLLADEPTASLDRRSAGEVADLLLRAAAVSGATMVVATHDPVLLDRIAGRLRLDIARVPA